MIKCILIPINSLISTYSIHRHHIITYWAEISNPVFVTVIICHPAYFPLFCHCYRFYSVAGISCHPVFYLCKHQIFPIIPISRLDERPDRTCTIQDITCDSDGKIANFITNHGTSSSLPVHSVRPGEPYYLGVFLVGAYQEILGDMHNLFGDTNAVHISVYKDRYEIDRIIDGETVAEVLDYVQFNPKKLVRNVETWVTASMKAGHITPEEGREFLSNYRSGLYGYTYLEKD